MAKASGKVDHGIGTRIIELRAENFKRLTAVAIRPEGGLVAITGRNGAGKSSVIDAVWAALGGKKAEPERPVREGEARADVTVDLGDLVVHKRFSPSGASSLTVETKDGLLHRSPQKVLDALVGRLSFDPLDFARMKPQDQAASLRELVGLDTSDLDARRRKAYDDRTSYNRDHARLLARAEALPFEHDAPDEPVSFHDLTNRHAEAIRLRQAHLADHQRRNDAALQLSDAETRLAKAREAVIKYEGLAKELLAEIVALDTSIMAHVAPDVAGIAAAIEGAEATNAAVEANRRRAQAIQEASEARRQAELLTDAIADVDFERGRRLAAAPFPIEGLAIDDEVVTFKGLPLSQASSAERLRVCLAIGAALNPKLRVILVRDGSLLDREGLVEVARWAEANDVQVLLEKVADHERDRIGIVIEDGHVESSSPMNLV